MHILNPGECSVTVPDQFPYILSEAFSIGINTACYANPHLPAAVAILSCSWWITMPLPLPHCSSTSSMQSIIIGTPDALGNSAFPRSTLQNIIIYQSNQQTAASPHLILINGIFATSTVRVKMTSYS